MEQTTEVTSEYADRNWTAEDELFAREVFKDLAADESEPQPTPVKLWIFGLEADELLTIYGALRVYLRTLVSQEREDLAMIKRTADLMLTVNPSAVEASKFVAEQTNTLKPAQI